MSDKKESFVRNEEGKIIQKDTTTTNDDGSKDTTHQDVYGGNVFVDPSPGNITGVTHHNADGTSVHKSK